MAQGNDAGLPLNVKYQTEASDYKLAPRPMDVMHHIFENKMYDLFSDAAGCANHANRKRIKDDDMKLVQRISRDADHLPWR